MKKLLIIALLVPALLKAQIINLRFGQLPFSNSMWNSWKTVSNVNNDTSAYLVDVFGNTTKIRVLLSNSGTAFDNLAGYLVGKGIYPDTVLRQGIYQGQGIAWSVTLIGLDTTTVYSISLFGSRNRTDGQGDKISIPGDTITFRTDTNTIRTAEFDGLTTKAGQLSFRITDAYIYSYLNAITIHGNPRHSAAHAKIWIDSNAIAYPSSVVRLSGSGSTGGVGAASWSIIGPSTVIFGQPIGGGSPDTICAAGLRPGTYWFRLMVQDSAGIFDSSFASVTVLPPVPCPVCAVCPTCPTCPVCPVCPAPRTVTGIKKDLLTGIITLTFNDGTLQSLNSP